MIDPELQTRFREWLRKCDESHLEYEEKHRDAGCVYVHFVMEDHLAAKNCIIRYIAEHGPEATQNELKAIIRRFDKWSFDMEPGHKFTTISPYKGVCLASYALEEVENQVEVSMLAEQLDCEPDEVRNLVRYERAETGSDFCIGTLYREDFDAFETYQCTDVCWFAVLPREWIVDTLNEIREEAAEADSTDE